MSEEIDPNALVPMDPYDQALFEADMDRFFDLCFQTPAGTELAGSLLEPRISPETRDLLEEAES